jgi:hypothetical protein
MMEETREEASRGIANNNKGRGAKGQHYETGEPMGNRTKGEPIGKNRERRKLRHKEEVHISLVFNFNVRYIVH